MQTITITQALKAFRVGRAQELNLRIIGKIPERPRGRVTAEWLRAIADYVERVRGEIPEAGVELLSRLEDGEKEGRVQAAQEKENDNASLITP